jgi:hypothetical protein
LPLLCQIHFRDCGYLDMRVSHRRCQIPTALRSLYYRPQPTAPGVASDICPGFAQNRGAAQNSGRVAQNPLGLPIDKRGRSDILTASSRGALQRQRTSAYRKAAPSRRCSRTSISIHTIVISSSAGSISEGTRSPGRVYVLSHSSDVTESAAGPACRRDRSGQSDPLPV